MPVDNIDWVQACVEAPLAVILALLVYKCYRARVKLSFDSPCSRCCGLRMKVEMPGDVSRSESDSSEPKGEGGEDIVRERAAHDIAHVRELATGESGLEQRARDADRFQREGREASKVIT